MNNFLSKNKSIIENLLASIRSGIQFSPNVKTQVHFIKRLSFLIRSETPLLQGLQLLSKQSPSQSFRITLEKVILDVSNGQSLSKSLNRHKGLLGVFAVHIIHIGEESGTLALNLEYLAEELKKRNALRKKIMSAFVYPVIVLIATLGITLFLILYLFPKIMPVFISLRMNLPLSTRVLIVVSEFLKQYWLVSIATCIFGITCLILLIQRNNTVRTIFDSALLRVSLFGPIIKSYHLTHITRVSGILLRSGLPLSETLPTVAEIVQSCPYREHLLEATVAVTRGEALCDNLMSAPNLYPSMAVHVISVGEKSGNLSSALLYLSDFFEEEVDEFTKNLGNVIEPLLMIVMGLLVGFIAISIITPIYGITQNLYR